MPACVCRKVREMGPFFWLQVNEMNEKMSFKMCMKFAASVYIIKGFPGVWHIFVCEQTGGKLQALYMSRSI